MSQDHADKRKFSRIPFDAGVLLHKGRQQWTSQLTDISLKGALVQQLREASLACGDQLSLDIDLGGEVVIRMEATVVHIESGQIGFRCDHIDLDSISHLRRIVELNTGSEELLHRELSALSDRN